MIDMKSIDTNLIRIMQSFCMLLYWHDVDHKLALVDRDDHDVVDDVVEVDDDDDDLVGYFPSW